MVLASLVFFSPFPYFFKTGLVVFPRFAENFRSPTCRSPYLAWLAVSLTVLFWFDFYFTFGAEVHCVARLA